MPSCSPTSKTAAMFGWLSLVEGEGFFAETAFRGFVGKEAGRENLDGDIASQSLVTRAVDYTHSPLQPRATMVYGPNCVPCGKGIKAESTTRNCFGVSGRR